MTTKEKLDAIINLVDALETNVRGIVGDFPGDTVALLELSMIQSSLGQIDRQLNRIVNRIANQRG